jgi:hypothetical protein
MDYWTNTGCSLTLTIVCVRGGPNQPLHRDPQWSIVLNSHYYLTLFLMVLYTQHFDVTCVKSGCETAVIPNHLTVKFMLW